jgi:hypothetical protein
MDSAWQNHFLNMIRQLRLKEEIMLYNNLLAVSLDDANAVADFLKDEFERESLDYPDSVPAFDSNAAAWAAKTVYLSAQFLLYRENNPEDLDQYLPPYTLELNASAIISADLCLRFLPSMITQLKLIDSEDSLISILENHLQCWHYSGVSYALDIEKLDFNAIASNPCLHALYSDRIVLNRKFSLAKHHLFANSVGASMGIYGAQLWKEFIE